MNKTLAATLSGLAMIVGASNALAQDSTQAQQNSAAISDSDIKVYASVAAKLNSIQTSAGLSEADKNTQMVAAVRDSGMDQDKFNAITSAARTDPQVKQKILEAMTK